MNFSSLEKAVNEYSEKYNDFKYIAPVRSGKEAEVHLVEVEETLAALKIYKKFTKFSSRAEYMPLDSILDQRARRAVRNKSNAGRRMAGSMWTYREWAAMNKIWERGCSVPQPFDHTNESILMEYIGDEAGSAPRLIEAELDYAISFRFFDEVLNNIAIFWDLGFTHGDLSAFNILIWENELYIIDFPQIVDAISNSNARKMLHKDICNVANFFEKGLGQEVWEKANHLEQELQNH